MLGNVVAIENEKSWQGAYEEEHQEKEFLKEFIGDASIKEIRHLREESLRCEQLKAEIKEKDSIIKEKDNTIKQLGDYQQQAIEVALKNQERLLEKEYSIETRNKVANAKANEAKRVRDKELAPVKQERDQLKISNEQLMEKLDLMHLDIKNIQEREEKIQEDIKRILDIVASSKTIEEAREKIGISNNKMTDIEIKELKEIYKTRKDSGETDKSIAEYLKNSFKPFMGLSSIDSAVQKMRRYVKGG